MKCVKCGVGVRCYCVVSPSEEKDVCVCDACVDGGYFDEYDEDDVCEYMDEV